MVLSRRAKLALKRFILDVGRLQELVDFRRARTREDSMGFRCIDIRPSVLNLAWKEVGIAGLSAKNPRLIHSSSFGATKLADERFDFVLSFSALFHLSDELLAACFLQVAKRLNQGGVCFAQVNTHLPDSTWPEFPFVEGTIAQYIGQVSAAGLEGRLLGTIEALGFRLPGEERLNEMLEFRP
jgi:hypothetical protein